MRTALTILLALLLSHLPVPFPDLDGECGGAPIHSLVECRAWYVLMLGVVPNDDIEYGPVRSNNSDERAPVDSPFGHAAMLNGTSVLGVTSIADVFRIHQIEWLAAATRPFEQPAVVPSAAYFISGNAGLVSTAITPETLRI